MTAVRCLVRRDTYRDSVELMRVASELEQVPGVTRAALLMATPANRALLAEAGLLVGTALAARPNDLVIAVAAVEDATAEAALARAERLLVAQTTRLHVDRRIAPSTIAGAIAEMPGCNLALISTPGPYATAEALKALKRGLHVFLFSDNVPVEDEVELKRLARKKGLLMMGPDCGTAIVDGVPLGFANAVRRGRIGLAGASGTGLQQVSCLLDRLGEGVSQLIGVGGRDLDERVGGLMMLAAIDLLAKDRGTEVIVLVSKPPAASVARDVLAAACASGKPVVVSFLGGDHASGPPDRRHAGRHAGGRRTDRRRSRARRSRAARRIAFELDLAAKARARVGSFASGQRHVRGLFSGGNALPGSGAHPRRDRGHAAPGTL